MRNLKLDIVSLFNKPEYKTEPDNIWLFRIGRIGVSNEIVSRYYWAHDDLQWSGWKRIFRNVFFAVKRQALDKHASLDDDFMDFYYTGILEMACRGNKK